MFRKSMKNIVIIGAGPIGLFLAIRLKQLGVNNVTVVDPRAGSYTRPGHLLSSIYKSFATDIGIDISHSTSLSFHHLKDVERLLHSVARDLKISIIKKKFKTFAENSIVIGDSKQSDDESNDVIPCDLLLECTGAHQVVIKEANKLESKEPPFTIEAIHDNPIKSHFLAYGKMSDEDAKKIFDGMDRENSDLTLSRTLIFENFRKEFGWTEFAMPHLELHQWERNQKVIIYFEVPPTLKKEQQEIYMKALLAMKSGRNDIEFKRLKEVGKYGKKPIFTPFTVNPERVTPAFFVGTEKIVPIGLFGDAQESADYRLGNGLRNGRIRANAWLQSITIENGNIESVDIEAYNAKLQPVMASYKDFLRLLYSRRQKALDDGLKLEKKRYKKSLSMTTDPEEKKIILSETAEINYRLAAAKYRGVLDAKEVIQISAADFTVKYEDKLINSKIALIRAFQMMPAAQVKAQIAKTLLDMAQKIQDAGETLFRAEQYDNSYKYYYMSLDIYNKIFPDQHKNTVVELYSKLAFLAEKLERFEDGLKYADLGLRLIGEDTQGHEEMIEKFRLNKRNCEQALKSPPSEPEADSSSVYRP